MDVKRRIAAVAMACIALQSLGRTQTPPATDEGDPPAEWIEYYAARYALSDPADKLTDDHGDGFEALYGTRNFREVLTGIAYRGGANNRWHRDGRRDNQNPLPDDALVRLCEEGFGSAYYLYTSNFESAPAVTTCHSPRSSEQALEYFQKSPSDEQDSYEMLRAAYETIKDYRHGPIYLQCWNGWHASGLIAAKMLRQFCDLSGEEAVEYWDDNTDGNNEEERFEQIRQQIRDFTPYPDLTITEKEAAMVCPAR